MPVRAFAGSRTDQPRDADVVSGVSTRRDWRHLFASQAWGGSCGSALSRSGSRTSSGAQAGIGRSMGVRPSFSMMGVSL
jgi:hypothetical protein